MSVAARVVLPARARAVPSAVAIEVAAVAAVTLAALAVRWPELATVPRFNDELREIAHSSQIARGEALPLINVSGYIGSFYNYLVAGALLLLGPRVEAWRVVVALAGALSVVPTYLLGRSLGGPAVGLLAALLLATSAAHVTVSSHIAYSHSLSPLFATTTLWLLHRAVAERSGPRLAAAGLAFGLALQTHPTTLTLAPGLAAYLLWKGRPLPGRWLALAAALSTLAVANVLLFNLATGLSGLAQLDRKSNIGLGAAPLSQDGLATRLLVLLGEVTLSMGSVLTDRAVPEPDSILYPIAALYTGLALAGIVLLARRGEWLPSLVMLSSLLGIWLVTAKYSPMIPNARFYAPVLPLAYVAAAVLVVAVYRRCEQFVPSQRVAHVVGLGAVLALLLVPLGLLHAYYEREHREARTNLPILATVDALERGGRLTDPVLLDRRLDGTPFPGGGLLLAIGFSLEVRGQKFQVVDVETGRLPAARRVGHRLVLHPDTVELAAVRYRLEPLPGEPGSDAPVRAFVAYPRSQS